MANSHADKNFKKTLIGISAADGTTILNIKVDPTQHYVYISDGTTGSDLGPTDSLHDENHQPTIMGVSSADLSTPVAIYVSASNQLLVKST